MASNNHLSSLTLLGNLVAEPNIRYQANPVIPVAEFTLATHKQWFDKQTKVKKEWTDFHQVKMIGKAVESSMLQAQKGDILHLQGYLVDSVKSGKELIHANYAQIYPKGYAKSLNQLQLSGVLHSEVKLVTLANEQALAELTLQINHQQFSPTTQKPRAISILRTLHLRGKSATYLAEHAKVGDTLIVDGKLSYLNNNNKSQLIDAQQVNIIPQRAPKQT